MTHSPSRQLITRYLLGELEADEERAVEERYFADDEWFALLLAVEARLIARYLRDELTPHERELFEHHFLRSAARRRRVAALGAAPCAELPPAHRHHTKRKSIGRWLRDWWRRLRR